uniref:Uncharacterized protein n=1 Tax=Anguilla anguilla TaxID=7936 RepID=A0A0E9SP26_ANGAN
MSQHEQTTDISFLNKTWNFQRVGVLAQTPSLYSSILSPV